ncbi:MAG: alginate lyase family protein [candidate division Zixibacteria bacterium]|nr:alginate lyase family protein [candidate division Zixibacteria bacterium]
MSSFEARRQEKTYTEEIGCDNLAALLDDFPTIFEGISSPDLVRALQRPPFAKQRQQLETLAQSAIEHRFDIAGHDMIRVGVGIDWSDSSTQRRRGDATNSRLLRQVYGTDEPAVQIPRGLSRCYHFLQMALQFFLTGNPAYPIEFADQIISWHAGNEDNEDINRTSSSETTFRVINWLLAYQVFAANWDFTDNFKTTLVIRLYKAGKHISGNLEKIAAGFNSSHYLANLLGLLYLGELFVVTQIGKEWRRLALRELEQECSYQIDDDGVDYESSLPYHGVATEILLFAYLLSLKTGCRLSSQLSDKLKKMMAVLRRFTLADGSILSFGDANEGRLIDLFGRFPDDFRDCIAIGERLLQLKEPDGGVAVAEELVVCGTEGINTSSDQQPHPKSSCCLKHSGICQMRSSNIVLDFFANPVGTAGLGNHKHNDILSFTLQYHNRPVFIDPGTYTCTENKTWRNYFRSTARHNTVMVDGQEQNRFVTGLFFLLRNDSKPKITLWKTDSESDLVVAVTDSYTRLDDPVVHRRSLYFDKNTEVILIKDELLGREVHQLETNFHIEAMEVRQKQSNCLHLLPEPDKPALLLQLLEPAFSFSINMDWNSPACGIKRSSKRLTVKTETRLPFTALYAITPLDHDSETIAARLEVARAAVGW